MATSREPKIVIIGGGIAGIATAVTLQRAGFHDFTILEKGADVGGVWHWNRYPGLTCDLPSQLYQFSFARNRTGRVCCAWLGDPAVSARRR
jgi:cation diffusion facilitator CzcD-associated flavoprotein CzcO